MAKSSSRTIGSKIEKDFGGRMLEIFVNLVTFYFARWQSSDTTTN